MTSSSSDPACRTDHDSRPLLRSWRPTAFGIDLPAYKPRPWLFDGRLHTIAVPLGRVPSLKNDYPSRRYIVPLEDGTGDRTDVYHYWPGSRRPGQTGRPTFVLLHGLGGHAHSAYITCSASNLLAAGYDVLMPNFRGAGTARDLASVLHHPGRSRDIDLMLAGLRDVAPDVMAGELITVGYSLGGHLLLKFLADYDVRDADDAGHRQIKAAVTVSAPLSLDGTSKALSQPLNKPFNYYLLRKIRHDVLRDNAVLSATERKLMEQARTVRQVDETITAPRLGEPSAESYYEANSAINHLAEIELPTLMIHSLDDPFVDNADYEHESIDANPMLDKVLLPDGGHVGFFTGQSGPRWIDQVLLQLVGDRFWERVGSDGSRG